MACKRSRVRISYSPRRIRTGCFDLGTACFAYEGEAFPYGGQTFPFRAGESGLSQRRNPPAGTNGTRFAARPCRDIRPQEYAREPRTDRRSMENSAIPTDKPWLFGLTLDELERIAAENGMPRFAARQIASWLYRKGADSIGGMTDLSLKNREKLAGKYELGTIPFADVQRSADGTKKYLFPTLQGRFIESAYIPDGDRATLCVSSQSGCRMGCRFCMTARQGFAHHLTAGEILESDPLDSRKRPADQRRLHGHGRAARQRGAGHPIDRGADLRLGIRLEPDADHRVDGRRDSRHAGAAATDPGASSRQPARPDPRRARSHDARRAPLSDRAGGRRAAAARLRASAPNQLRIHRLSRSQRYAGARRRVDAAARRAPLPDQPDPLPRDSRRSVRGSRRTDDGPSAR